MPPRLVQAARAWSPAVVGAWALTAALASLVGRMGPLSATFAAGALGIAALVAIAALAAGSGLVGRWPQPGEAPHRRAAWVLVAAAATTLVVWAPGRWVADLLLPAAVDMRTSFVGAVGTAVAATVGVAAAAAARPLLKAGPPGVTPPLVAAQLVVARVLAAGDLAVAFTGREVLLDLATLAALVTTLRPIRPPPALVRAGAALLGASILTLFVALDAQPIARAELAARAPGASSVVAWTRSHFDLDGDGFSAVLGGGDCDDSRHDVHPGALEIVGNGVDDNCQGGDLSAPPTEADSAPPPEGPRRSVLLVTVDTLRADHLDDEHTPRLSAFAKGGAVFRNAYAQAPYTDHSVRSLMTGRHPWDFHAFGKFLGQSPSLAERLAACGHATDAIHSIWALSAYAEQGFQGVDDSLAVHNRAFRGVTADATTAKAIAALDRGLASTEPFLLWVHYFDPHSDYVPRAGTPFEGSTPRDRYAQEVWATDRALGRLLDRVRESGFLQRGVVAVTSDHGELLGEGGRLGHGWWLVEELMRVPLVVRGATVTPGTLRTRVGLVDLMPTLTALGCGGTPPADGRSLAPVWRGEETADRDVFAWTGYKGVDRRAAWSGAYKLTHDLVSGAQRLTLLGGSGDNLVERAPDELARMRSVMGRRWDLSLNDLHLAAKLEALPGRLIEDRVLRARERRVLESRCATGDASACRQLETSPTP